MQFCLHCTVYTGCTLYIVQLLLLNKCYICGDSICLSPKSSYLQVKNLTFSSLCKYLKFLNDDITTTPQDQERERQQERLDLPSSPLPSFPISHWRGVPSSQTSSQGSRDQARKRLSLQTEVQYSTVQCTVWYSFIHNFHHFLPWPPSTPVTIS